MITQRDRWVPVIPGTPNSNSGYTILNSGDTILIYEALLPWGPGFPRRNVRRRLLSTATVKDSLPRGRPVRSSRRSRLTSSSDGSIQRKSSQLPTRCRRGAAFTSESPLSATWALALLPGYSHGLAARPARTGFCSLSRAVARR